MPGGFAGAALMFGGDTAVFGAATDQGRMTIDFEELSLHTLGGYLGIPFDSDLEPDPASP